MAQDVAYTSILAHPPGTIASLLRRSYQRWAEVDIFQHARAAAKWKALDHEFYDHPDTIGRCAIVTCLDQMPIGFACWDPRLGPELAILGHNCIVPEWQGRGYGRRQIREVLRRLCQMGFRKVAVTTGDDPFFAPARRMYEACGFAEVAWYPRAPDPTHGAIKYEMHLHAYELQLQG